MENELSEDDKKIELILLYFFHFYYQKNVKVHQKIKNTISSRKFKR